MAGPPTTGSDRPATTSARRSRAMAGEMLFKCPVCAPATDHGSAPTGTPRDKRWRTVDIHCHCMVPAANEYVLKATGIPGGRTDTNAQAHVNDLSKSLMRERAKIDFPKLTDIETRIAD